MFKTSERFRIISLIPFMDNNDKARKIAGETSAHSGLVAARNLSLT